MSTRLKVPDAHPLLNQFLRELRPSARALREMRETQSDRIKYTRFFACGAGCGWICVATIGAHPRHGGPSATAIPWPAANFPQDSKPRAGGGPPPASRQACGVIVREQLPEQLPREGNCWRTITPTITPLLLRKRVKNCILGVGNCCIHRN